MFITHQQASKPASHWLWGDFQQNSLVPQPAPVPATATGLNEQKPDERLNGHFQIVSQEYWEQAELGCYRARWIVVSYWVISYLDLQTEGEKEWLVGGLTGVWLVIGRGAPRDR